VFNFGSYDGSVSLEEYRMTGGYEALRKVLQDPQQQRKKYALQAFAAAAEQPFRPVQS
jgi:hypothetical protein